MSSRYIRLKRKSVSKGLVISPRSQFERIKQTFPNVQVLSNQNNSFEVDLKLQPSVFSKIYDVKICYHKINGTSIYIIDEKLKIASNRKKLPHVYSHEKQEICLFSYGNKEWTREKSISSTIIPWASEWLYYYELWLIDGQWLGGGHNEYENELNIEGKNEEKI